MASHLESLYFDWNIMLIYLRELVKPGSEIKEGLMSKGEVD